MNQAAGKEIMDVLVASEAASRNFSQNFEYQQHIITHQHHIEVELTDQKGRPFQISNYFATVEQGKVVKVTEIMLENRTIKIIDSFLTVNTAQKSPLQPETDSLKQSARNYSRRQILSKKYHGNASSESCDARLRDTKNLVKNIIRLFQSWLEERREIGGDVYQGLYEVIKNGKFNNNLIITMSQTPMIRAAFLRFCDGNAEDFIAKSKIHDKSSHLEALKKYENICREEEEIEEEKREERDGQPGQFQLEKAGVEVQQQDG